MPRAHDARCESSSPRRWGFCICQEIRAAYREGYSDHARAVQHWQDTHGAYRQTQHGNGENP